MHNYSMILEGKKEIKNENELLPDIFGIKFENNNNKNDLFLTGRNELIEMKENNEKLIKELNILKNENIELDNKLKKVNQLVSKLKIQISENEKQKNLILTTSNQKEIDLQNIKKQLEQTKSKLDELKNKNKENLILISNQNNIIKNKSEKDN